MNVLGTHVLLELRNCDPQLLNDLPYIRQELVKAAEQVGAHIVGESFHQFTPQGVTGILSIAESHISIHTWPEFGYAAADVFTCGDQTMPDRAAESIIAALQCRDPQITQIRRGLRGVRIAELQPARLTS